MPRYDKMRLRNRKCSNADAIAARISSWAAHGAGLSEELLWCKSPDIYYTSIARSYEMLRDAVSHSPGGAI